MFCARPRALQRGLCHLRQLHATARPNAQRPLRVLGLESSADDACAAVVTSDRRILSSAVCKQHDINRQWGGIHPIAAHEAHLRDMPKAIAQALAQAQLGLTDIDAVAYTRGPGMFGCLSVCTTAARALAAASGKPLAGVHHMQAHALTALLTEPEPPQFPFLTLLVSGGHTQLVLAESMDKYRIAMTTTDNAVGDVFDKVARLLRLPPSPTGGLGPVLEEYAARPPLPPYDAAPLRLPPPLAGRNKDVLAFSFSGLLSATERLAKKEVGDGEGEGEVSEAVQRAVSRAFQAAAVKHLADKVRLAIDSLGIPVKGLVVSGGVGSNKYLREQLKSMCDGISTGPVPTYYPPISLCTDNAAMIAWTAILRLQDGLVGEPFDLPIRKKWSLEDLYDDVPASCYRS
ncbi:peptidase M22, glycoprotease [Cutaneotrichosporon oleaginosum]|uniref:N(6)-L-threonylcarbamoyladenine synthase n=1 Tax=Cutaneotrichosporon oleaginosum TaxID=879819 RepID=A0A0J0XDR7_9TREE|nr:peptidase M22, glycoprotease [Cutaneotrichosporon oleaginosum]KLT39163.1 peptidase M22, glycoprotease [Cutaneotrichosporon oleaginosum]TXT05319.1 hypothetical protein COLE_06639 [Cutaneotrichosporon oleaginosum]